MSRLGGFGLLAALVLLSGPAAFADAQDRDGDTRDGRGRERPTHEAQSIDTSFRMERGGLLDLELVSGQITVTGVSGNLVTIRASAAEGHVVLRASARLTTLRAERERGRSSNVRYEVGVPAGVRVIMEATSGTLTARGIEADVDASTVSGSIELRDIGGMATVEAVSGEITASGVRGGIHIEATSGPVSISDAAGEVIVEHTSGDITLRDVRSRLVRIETVSGDLRFDGSIDPNGRYEFETHSGTIRLALPPTVGAELTLSTFSGSLSSDFPITPAPRSDRREKRLQFRLGGGGARITAETFSGSVVITRGVGRDRPE